jgi:hypothetical protein
MTKRKPMVSQHLENISREALEKYQNILHLYFPLIERSRFPLLTEEQIFWIMK